VRAELVEAEYVPFEKLRAHLPPAFHNRDGRQENDTVEDESEGAVR
jgi:hypothetical protein